MNLQAGKNSEHLTLSNVQQKMKMLRDQMRQSADQNIRNMKHHIDDYNQKRQYPTFLPNDSSFQDRDNQQQYNKSSFNQRQSQIRRDLAINNKTQEHISAQPQHYRYLTLVDRQIDFDELKYLNTKKISAEETGTFIKFVLNQDVWDKIEEIWLQFEDEQQKVDLKTFVNRLFRLGLHYIQAVAVEIPKIKKKVNFKKVLFQIAYKYQTSDYRKITWKTFKLIVQNYKYEISPTIDTFISKIAKERQRRVKNHFIISPQVIAEVKNIYKSSSADLFLSYCNVGSLIEKLQKSIIIVKNMNSEVRRKSHQQASTTIKNIIDYMKKKSPNFIDLDELILYFSTHPFAFYPIQERQCCEEQQSESKPQKNSHSKRMRSVKSANSKEKSNNYNFFIQTFNFEKINTRQNLQENFNDKQQVDSEERPYKFKARPVPKSISKQKYDQFLHSLTSRKQQMRKRQLQQKQISEKVLERMKSETKLLNYPKHSEYSPIKPQGQLIKINFKAKPVPETVLQPKMKTIQQEKNNRKNKILSLNVQKYKHSWSQLPVVATLRNQSPKKQAQNEQSRRHYHYAKEIPDYKAQQMKVIQQLEEKKKRFKPTQVHQFYFQTQQRHPEIVSKHQTQQNCNQPSYKQEDQYDYKKFLYSPKPEIYYTQKYTDMIIANKNRAYQCQLSLNKKLQEQQERQKKHRNFAKFMKGPISKIPNTAKICQLQGKAKIQRHKKQWKKLDIQYENQLNQLYSKVIKRPFLYQLQSTNPQTKRMQSNDSPQHKKKKKTKNTPKYTQNAHITRQIMNKSL